jgi:FkbM family methyltransferase
MTYVYFDVGANWGEKSLPGAKQNQDWKVFAFEPTPHLAMNLLHQSMMFRDRYEVIQLALSDYNGSAEFNIQNHPGQGCNSLNDFNDGLDKIFPHFVNETRNDMKVIQKISVKVSRLDTWFNSISFPYETIDYFKCDVQGSDLKVLQGMGDFIHLIAAGEVECSRSPKTRLYKNNNVLEETVEFLKEKGFRVPKILSNDHLDNEYNIHFERV